MHITHELFSRLNLNLTKSLITNVSALVYFLEIKLLLDINDGCLPNHQLLFKTRRSQAKMKLAPFIAILALVGLATSLNSTWGYIGYYDNLIHHSIRRSPSKFWRVSTEDFRFRSNSTITAIRVIDQIPRSNGTAQIYAGGVGYNYTTIHFKSERNKGYNFFLEIYARR